MLAGREDAAGATAGNFQLKLPGASRVGDGEQGPADAVNRLPKNVQEPGRATAQPDGRQDGRQKNPRASRG